MGRLNCRSAQAGSDRGRKGRNIMTWDHIEDKWSEFAGSARAHWSKLTEDDWQALTGKKTHLVGRVQHRYELTRDQAEKQVDDWCRGLTDFVEAAKSR
jgi:uncharacterized protein YjbJ (UPF0337 family)